MSDDWEMRDVIMGLCDVMGVGHTISLFASMSPCAVGSSKVAVLCVFALFFGGILRCSSVLRVFERKKKGESQSVKMMKKNVDAIH